MVTTQEWRSFTTSRRDMILVAYRHAPVAELGALRWDQGVFERGSQHARKRECGAHIRSAVLRLERCDICAVSNQNRGTVF